MSEEKEISIEFGNTESRPKPRVAGKSETSIEREASFSDDAPETEEALPGAEVDFQRKAADLEERLVRTLADFDNYKKRNLKFQEELARSANDRIIQDMLGVMDNFERAAAHGETSDLNSLRQGIQLIHSQFLDLLKKYEITPIDAIGKPFDSSVHEALMKVDSNEYPEGHVALEVNKGYRQGERIIRHSRVGVSTGKAKS